MRDELESKQNAISILLNASVIKAKKEAMGGTFLVNSRLVKNKDELNKPSIDTKYIFLDENIAEETPISNAMYELPNSEIKQDVFTMIRELETQAVKDTKIDSLQQ
jgi:hypothetical protein